jgi:hypothetical protein
MTTLSLTDLGRCRGASDATLSWQASYLQAILGNFVLALHHLSLVHSDEGSFVREAHTFFENVLNNVEQILRENRRSVHELTLDGLYGVVTSMLREPVAYRLFQRAMEPRVCPEHVGFTVQSHKIFLYWLEEGDPARGWLDDPHPEDALRLVNDFNQSKIPTKRDQTLGASSEVLWLTPLMGEVKKLVEFAEQHQSRPIDLAIGDTANRLRAILGLWQQPPGVHLIGFRTRRKLADLRGKIQHGPVAPTVFDSRHYQRFRYWPYPQDPNPEDIGRTYDLDQIARARAQHDRHGAPEVVCAPLSLAQVESAIYLGTVNRVDDFGPRSETFGCVEESDRAYLREICRGRNLSAVLGELSEALGL